MFKRENRLIPQANFRNSRFYVIPQLVLKEKENGLSLNRFGIVVSKRIDKRAVIRNKIKRSLRIILINLNKKMNSGHDILLIVKKNIVNKTKEENLFAVENVFEKLGLIKK
jgi:ribonuclease P protein component